MQHLKVTAANLASWGMTFFSFEFAKDVLQLLALIGSICVSAVSVWYVKKKIDWKEEDRRAGRFGEGGE